MVNFGKRMEMAVVNIFFQRKEVGSHVRVEEEAHKLIRPCADVVI